MIIAVTGAIGSGKSTVARMLAAQTGFALLDADRIAKRFLRKGTQGYELIVSFFGGAVTTKDGSINAKALADVVFADPKKLSSLNRLVHPFVERAIRQKLEQQGDAILDIPLLIEADMAGIADCIVVVTCPVKTAEKRSHFTAPDRARRRRAQLTERQKLATAKDAVGTKNVFAVDNSGSRKETAAQVIRVVAQMRHRP